MKHLLIAAMGLFVFASFGTQADAHKQLRDALQERYKEDNLKVHCNFCHVKSKPKSERSAFGNLVAEHEALKGNDYSTKIKAAHKAKEKDEKERLLGELVEAYKTSMDDLEKVAPTEGGKTYGELIKAKELEYLSTEEDEDDD